MNSLAVIIPMLNEEQNATRCVRTICKVIESDVTNAKLFVVNDGSKDRTSEILTGLQQEGLSFHIVTHATNYGYGRALLSGAKAAEQAGFTYGLFMDSDLTNDPTLIPVFAKTLTSNQFDLVKASRYVHGGGMRGVPLYRKLISIVGNKIAAALFNIGIKDCTNGFHAVRLSLITDVEFKESGFPFLLEELYILKSRGARGTEIPYILTARKSEDGVSSFSYRPQVVAKYFKYALKSFFVKSQERLFA